jgi:hypothetical protein
MSVDVTYRCNGCQAAVEVKGLIRRWKTITPNAITAHGIAYDRCRVDTPDIESAAPEGWVAFDPWTGMTYCPTCWASIVGDEQVETSLGGHR